MPTTFNYMGIVYLMHKWSCKKECQCIDETAAWMKANQMKHNSSKTEVIWFSTSRSIYKLPTKLVLVLNDHIIPSDSVKNLGVYFDRSKHEDSHKQIIANVICIIEEDKKH